MCFTSFSTATVSAVVPPIMFSWLTRASFATTGNDTVENESTATTATTTAAVSTTEVESAATLTDINNKTIGGIPKRQRIKIDQEFCRNETNQVQDDQDSYEATRIRTALEKSSIAWNTGNLHEYLDIYAEDTRYVSESLVTTGSATEMVLYGKDAVVGLFSDTFERAKMYQTKQKKQKGVAGLLSYSSIDVHILGSDRKNAIVFGYYRLELNDKAIDNGVFTLHMIQHENGDWKVKSEHSSAATK